MKKLISLMIVGTVALHAGVFTSISGWTADKIQPDAYYTVDTIGENVRVYEFTPKLSQNVRCIMMFTESEKKSPTMQCFKKEEK